MCSENKEEKLKELLDYVRGDYNVFYATKAYTAEVVHSGMIADLLNPKGHHLLGDIPLQKFCKILNISIEPDGINVETERKTDEDRFVDIYIEDRNNKVIIIENKIKADDQDHQLYDYYQYGRQIAENQDNFQLYYLSGNEKRKEPQRKSLISKDQESKLTREDFKLLSYRKHILPWVEDILSIEKLYQGHVLFYLTLLQYRDAVEDLVKGEEILLNKINAAIYEKVSVDCKNDGGKIAEYLSKRLTEKLINRFKTELGDAACFISNEGLIIINKEHVAIRIQSNFWCYYEDTDNGFFLNELLPNNPLATFWNTTKQIEKIAELTPNDLEFLLSDKEVYSPNFEQIINTLTKYIDIVIPK